ncbi:protein of unknown function [Vibrio tapetis subsp. tapetis]|uniref:Uncharacterized protein n=1 Tax=Vibrio tapetis subsp. tapetis TaxID=1671868 RepID=A0A2N8ZIC0_9VIBR|nr:protein of unknown function [Vibrio tapetis subsp. tapetis]
MRPPNQIAQFTIRSGNGLVQHPGFNAGCAALNPYLLCVKIQCNENVLVSNQFRTFRIGLLMTTTLTLCLPMANLRDIDK